MLPITEGEFCRLQLFRCILQTNNANKIAVKPAERSIFCFWNATMKRRSQYTICIQVAGLDRMNLISTASLNSRWNKEVIKYENYF